MARRTDHSREELLELVVDAGTRIIAEEGIGAMTARKVASAIGYSPGSIYNVVENIDALIAHVNTRTMRALNAELDRIGMTGQIGDEPDHDRLEAAGLQALGIGRPFPG